MAKLGWFHGQRVELMDGQVVVMTPQKPRHYAVLDRAAEMLRRVFGEDYWVRAQAPLDLGESTEPEPDVSVVRGRREEFEKSSAHPQDADLILEVSEASLAYDRTRKGSLYACRRIKDYWIANLVDRQLEVYRDPIADESQEFGYRYKTLMILKPGESVTALVLPGVALEVSELLH
jgi:Uma2 family endonuclease